jgi:hypothetical protein
MVAPGHEMLSAFTHDSIRSWVYLEATMNDHLRHLLNLTPGIIRNQSGLIFQHIDSSDGLRLLKMQHASPPEVGKWVQVRRGIYKGDVGYVTSTKSGGVQLLLIPRLSQPGEFPPTLVPRPHYSTMRPSCGFIILSLSVSERMSTHFEETDSSMGWLSNHTHPT